MNNPGGLFGATSETALPIQPIWPIFEVNKLNWQCCLAGSSKTAPRILIFSIAMIANYSFDVTSIDIWAPAFFEHNNSFIATVKHSSFEVFLTRKEGCGVSYCKISTKLIFRDIGQVDNFMLNNTLFLYTHF